MHEQDIIIRSKQQVSPDNIKAWLQAGITHGINLFFPPRCVACQQAGSWFCPSCAQQVEAVGDTICLQCGRPMPRLQKRCDACWAENTPALSMMRIAAIHASPLREAIHALKYERRSELATALARYLVVVTVESSWRLTYLNVDGVIPVPLHRQRYQQRGYNQAALLAESFCDTLALPLRDTWLSRERSTQSQVGLSAIERQQNVSQAFVAASDVRDKRLLLIDDVYTTGATLQACARALQDAGATAVYGLALACPR